MIALVDFSVTDGKRVLERSTRAFARPSLGVECRVTLRPGYPLTTLIQVIDDDAASDDEAKEDLQQLAQIARPASRGVRAEILAESDESVLWSHDEEG